MNRLSGVSLPAIVGDDAAAVSDPVKLASGVLTVRVDEAMWASEFRWLEPTILTRVRALSNSAANSAAITSVKVVVRPR
jgi:hypothetical protein